MKKNNKKWEASGRPKMKLLPCPFCGEKAKLLDGITSFHVACSSNGCDCILKENNINDIYPWYRTKENAIKYWNRRNYE